MNSTNGSYRGELRDDILDDVRNFLRRAQRDSRRRKLPVITLAYAQSIDGSIALNGGGKLHLSNSASMKLTHRTRSHHDAILVGINTILADDPRLTVRLAHGTNPQPVVVDSHLRFPLEAKLLRDPCVRPIIATSDRSCVNKEAELTAAGAQVLRVPVTADGRIDLVHLMRHLKDCGLESVMVEGGAGIITNMLATGLADQILVTIAPRFVAGLRAVKSLSGKPHVEMPCLTNLHYALLAGDLVVRGDLVHERSTDANDQISRHVTANALPADEVLRPHNAENEGR